MKVWSTEAHAHWFPMGRCGPCLTSQLLMFQWLQLFGQGAGRMTPKCSEQREVRESHSECKKRETPSTLAVCSSYQYKLHRLIPWSSVWRNQGLKNCTEFHSAFVLNLILVNVSHQATQKYARILQSKDGDINREIWFDLIGLFQFVFHLLDWRHTEI